MEQLRSRQGLEEQENVPINGQDLVKNSQKNPHITAKELQKRVAGIGLSVHRTTIQRTLNNKDRLIHGRVARNTPFLRPQHKIKILKYGKKEEYIKKPEAFWNNVL